MRASQLSKVKMLSCVVVENFQLQKRNNSGAKLAQKLGFSQSYGPLRIGRNSRLVSSMIRSDKSLRAHLVCFSAEMQYPADKVR